MEISTEVNQVLDKLAEILGSTSGEIVEAYTQQVFVEGLTLCFSGLIFLIVAILFVKHYIKHTKASHITTDKDAQKEHDGGRLVGIIVSVLCFFIAFVLFSSSIAKLFAPKAVVIKELILQLTYF